MVVLWLTFLIFHLCYYFSSPLLQLFKCHCVEVTLLLTGSFHGSFHVLQSVIDASCEAKKCISRRNSKGISFIRVVVKSKTEDEELSIEMLAFRLLRPVAILHYQDKVSSITSQPPSLSLNPPLSLPFPPPGVSLWCKSHSSYFVNSLNIKAKPGRTEFGKF